MNIPKDLTLKKLHDGLARKEFSAYEMAEAYFGRIDDRDKEIGAYLSLMKDDAMRTAAAVDAAVQKEDTLPPLAGAPLAFKDNILVKGHRATAGSRILENYTASYEGGVVQRLKSEHAVLLGKTNLDEFAMGASTENSGFRPTKNPRDTSLVPGGSSGGSAAAVADGMALAALGSDTGGSIRQPAAFCGVVGLKASYGTVSRSGLIALASSLDQIGPFTRTVEDAAILFRAIKGHDPLDPTSAPPEAQPKDNELLHPDMDKVRKLKIGLPKEYFLPGMDKEVEVAVLEAVQSFKDMGFDPVPVSLPHTKHALSTYYIILPAEASSNLARFDGIRYGRHQELANDFLSERGHGFGTEVKRRIILGTFVLSAGYYDTYYKKAQQVRTLMAEDFERAFQKVDVILAPVTPTLPFAFGEKANDPVAMYLSDVFTIPVNLAGLPALSIPVKGRENKLPVGFQLIGRRFREADILGLGEMYEKK